MKLFQYRIGSLVKTLLFLLIGLFSLLLNTAQAQFTITENFRGQVGPNIIIGDDARLTSGNIDPVGAGWLRLTPDENSKQGYAYINRTFPSTLGVLADFEYKMYRNNTSDGADGISVFLFDGTYGPGTFKLGRYGGALGYGPGGSANGPQDGLSGGYVGIALDAFGNFSTTNHGGPAGGVGSPSAVQAANSITMRGKTIANRTTSNPLLARKELTGTNLIDYNTKTSTRPGDNVFYRRVQVEMTPVEGGIGFLIKLRWKTTPNGTFEDLVTYTYNEVPPKLLKIGFGASTGGFNNVHEIRNVVVTTPGNLRVSKLADKDVLRTRSTVNENQVTYTVEVNNDTDADLKNVDFKDRITDGAGNMVGPDTFVIDEIKHVGFLQGTALPSTSTTNEFTGSLNIAAKTIGRITVKGRLLKVPIGNILINTATALPTDITDQDLENNTSIVKTPVIAEGVDLVVSETVDNACLNPAAGNTFTVNVANMGAGSVSYGGMTTTGNNDIRDYTANKLELRHTIPSGVTLAEVSIPEGWEEIPPVLSNTDGSKTYIYRTKAKLITGNDFSRWGDNPNTAYDQSLASGSALPAFTFKLKGVASFESRVRVGFVQEKGKIQRVSGKVWKIDSRNPATEERQDLEPQENRNNNSASASVLITPPVPTLTQKVFYYCQGEEAMPLQILPTNPNYKIVWYSSLGGVPLNNVPTPITTNAGKTSYYVSQTNGSCESAAVEIQIVVLPPPIAGKISGGKETCVGTAAGTISSTEDAIASGWPMNTVIIYRWEKLSPASGANWTVISGATGENYLPAAETIVGVWKYRRVAIPVLAGKESACRPEAISKEVSITVKNCLIISNPMLRSRARK